MSMSDEIRYGEYARQACRQGMDLGSGRLDSMTRSLGKLKGKTVY